VPYHLLQKINILNNLHCTFCVFDVILFIMRLKAQFFLGIGSYLVKLLQKTFIKLTKARDTKRPTVTALEDRLYSYEIQMMENDVIWPCRKVCVTCKQGQTHVCLFLHTYFSNAPNC
jgi:hypothetical protein